MNPSIEKLYQIAQKEKRTIIGLMSGTSLDGLDVALCEFTGSGDQTTVVLKEFLTIPFESQTKSEIRSVFAQQNIDFPKLCMLNPWIGRLHGKMVNRCLKTWGMKSDDVDLIASHGQTVMHMPKRLHKNELFPDSTLQIGDADHLANETGILTLSDFRQKHCAAGGEGAPLALYGDYLLFSSKQENRVLINIGGIANFTFLPSTGDFSKVFATDTGPGNTLIDAFTQKHFDKAFDENAIIAKRGQLSIELLDTLLEHEYFTQSVPKTTGPELFNLDYVKKAIAESGVEISKEDILHTLCHFTAKSLTQEIKRSVNLEPDTVIYLSGGGMHNPLLVELIKQELPNVHVKIMNVLGVSGDAKEAVLFAALANETLAGQGFISPNNSEERFFMGKISLPL
ncbi:anhydro-N-acetylmuramic acid kinase [Jiulongibacter sp. NS-SX5]|uniref:anhydro-N-acetylmuramic acid kinase n=1 Tax=Jiulongibacter sp. NS-SX5 TaxID=3463854 RepID=UPI004058923C